MNWPLHRVVVCVLLALGLVACGPDTDDLEKKVTEIKSRKTTEIEPIPQMKQFEAFAYDPAGRRDPFAAAEPQRGAPGGMVGGLAPDKDRNKEPLEEFPLDALRMLGVIEAAGKTYAMVKAPDGVVHRVVVKDHLGQNYGQITSINETEVNLMEIIPDGFGGWIQRPAVLTLAE